MKTHLFFIVIVITIITPIYPAFETVYPGGRATGMGGAFTAVSNDIESIGYNPAGLMNIKKYNLFGSQKDLWGGVDGLKHTIFYFGYGNRKLGGFGFAFEELGYDIDKQRSYQINYGKKLNRFMGLGVNVKYYKYSVESFGSDSTFGLDFGYLSKVMKNVYFGVNLKNINNPKVGTTIRKELEKSVTGGISYINKFLTLAVDVMKTPDYRLQYRYGGELILFKFLALRGGINNDPNSRFFGFGFNFKNIKLSFSQFNHDVIPSTHQMSLKFEFGAGGVKKNKMVQKKEARNSISRQHISEKSGEKCISLVKTNKSYIWNNIKSLNLLTPLPSMK